MAHNLLKLARGAGLGLGRRRAALAAGVAVGVSRACQIDEISPIAIALTTACTLLVASSFSSTLFT